MTRKTSTEAPRRRAVRASTGAKNTRDATQRYWSQRVTENSNALDLEPGVFLLGDPGEIARSLKRSAEQSRRRKSDPFRSAMSMLNFYINRAGRGLRTERKRVLNRAKGKLRALFGRTKRISSRFSDSR